MIVFVFVGFIVVRAVVVLMLCNNDISSICYLLPKVRCYCCSYGHGAFGKTEVHMKIACNCL